MVKIINETLWFKDAIIYEVPVKSFADSNGDGTGDLQGLISKLDYLQDLGITAIWLLPFFPSPQRDDGYDVADYTDINAIYGSLVDFKTLVDQAHQRQIRVIIELVINHTSDQHPWFQRARRALPGSPERAFYVWSDTPEKYPGVRVIFQDFETANWTWDPVGKAYYWHRFYSHQPDLNFDNPAVHKALFEALDFWLHLGVDGFRLDAVPYLYEREGTNCENLPETHAFLKQLRSYVDVNYPDTMLLAEANQWPEDAIIYMGSGDECHMNFHFPLMPRLFMAIQQEDRFPIVDILQQTPPIPDTCQWAIFLRNHDELTLEMVTDEDRDYMYRVYATDPRSRINLGIRRRLAPLLGNNRRSMELMNGLLLSLPGTPVLYYGDEIGMGDNIYLGDRNGVRTPMQWSADRNAGFSQCNPQRLFLPIVIEPEYHYETINVETQRNNPNSLWWWMKRLIAVRKRFRAFGQGSFQMLYPDNRKVLTFLRIFDQERILVVVNLSRYTQCVELDLASFDGLKPVEVFGRIEFPPISKLPYFLTLGAYSFYWFSLEQTPNSISCLPGPDVLSSLPLLSVKDRWQTILMGEASIKLEQIIPDYLCRQLWFQGRYQVIQHTKVRSTLYVPVENNDLALILLGVEYATGSPETYLLPLMWVPDTEPQPQEATLVAQLKVGTDDLGFLVDALRTRMFLLQMLERALIAVAGVMGAEDLSLRFLKTRDGIVQGVLGDRWLITVFRRVESGIHPAWELGHYLSQHRAAPPILPMIGSVHKDSLTLAVVQDYLPSEGDAWSYTLDNLAQFFDRLLLLESPTWSDPIPQVPAGGMLDWKDNGIPDLAYAAIGDYLESARQLGETTKLFHRALISNSEDPAFCPERFTTLYQRSIYQSMRNLLGQVVPLLKARRPYLPEEIQALADRFLQHQDTIIGLFQRILSTPVQAYRTRIHGNYHLGQLLFTGKGFLIANLSGDTRRPLTERRIKRSPLRDLAGLLYSFYYATRTALDFHQVSGISSPEQMERLGQWGRFWYRWVSTVCCHAYLDCGDSCQAIPSDPQQLRILLNAFLLEECLLELQCGLEQRFQEPESMGIPLFALLDLLDEQLNYQIPTELAP